MRTILFGVFVLIAVGFGGLVAQSANDGLDQIRAYVPISDNLATSGQITVDQIADIKAAGFEVIVNLATARREQNGEEGFAVAEAGLTYINIPVVWEEPTMRDLDMFFSVMRANEDRKVFVHCFANMRASAFTYLYRTQELNIDPVEAKKAMDAVWDPNSQEQWAEFIQRALER
jgi:protein tyrosine phosphatase (PTP) superfamily phosphohydrolase (DUF442 family)